MKRIFNYLKKFVTWDRGNPELKKYDVQIVLLVTFLIVYTTCSFLSIKKGMKETKDTVVKVELRTIYPTNTLLASQTNHSLVIDSNSKLKFQVGEVVGAKHLGVIGIITEKTLGLGGYKYQIIYRDGGGVLQQTEIPTWLLYHPHKEQISPYFLLN